jgi:hypothetical protein
MKKIITYIFFCCTIFVLVSCGTPIKSLLKGNFTNYFDGKYTGLDTLLNTNGCYRTINTNEDGNRLFIFYNDGTYGSRILFDFRKLIINLDEKFDDVGAWGHYYISGDTIKAQNIELLGGVFEDKYTYDLVLENEQWFKIISKDTIAEIYFNCFDPDRKSRNKIIYAAFNPLNEKPDSNCWLKKNSWAWKDGIIKK